MAEVTIGLIVSMRIGVVCMCDVCVYLRRQVDSGSRNVNQNLDDVGPHNVKRTGAGGTAPVRVLGEKSHHNKTGAILTGWPLFFSRKDRFSRSRDCGSTVMSRCLSTRTVLRLLLGAVLGGVPP